MGEDDIQIVWILFLTRLTLCQWKWCLRSPIKVIKWFGLSDEGHFPPGCARVMQSRATSNSDLLTSLTLVLGKISERLLCHTTQKEWRNRNIKVKVMLSWKACDCFLIISFFFKSTGLMVRDSCVDKIYVAHSKAFDTVLYELLFHLKNELIMLRNVNISVAHVKCIKG